MTASELKHQSDVRRAVEICKVYGMTGAQIRDLSNAATIAEYRRLCRSLHRG